MTPFTYLFCNSCTLKVAEDKRDLFEVKAFATMSDCIMSHSCFDQENYTTSSRLWLMKHACASLSRKV